MQQTGRRWLSVILTAGLVLFLASVALVLLRYQPFAIPSSSMASTLQIGDRVLADRWDTDAQRGDIIVFNASSWGAGSTEIKRVLGIGGDKVSCIAGGPLLVNGEPVLESYLPQIGSCATTSFDVVVPAGRVFLLGDNRNSSLDSRAHLDQSSGTISVASIQAKYSATIYPADHASIFPTNGFIKALFGGAAAGLLLSVLAGFILTVQWLLGKLARKQ